MLVDAFVVSASDAPSTALSATSFPPSLASSFLPLNPSIIPLTKFFPAFRRFPGSEIIPSINHLTMFFPTSKSFGIP